ncbi:plastid division protein PDV2 [Malania oleifera]|uniref:plastid division protein PDV2 n=1 Tax=Malania oleifera TaxID=397392 RepID=UPI0025AE7CDE|nr:plastid division protein PDV2 [Malania oleifera]
MEEDEGIGVVLARASELRSKITNCLRKETAAPPTTHSSASPEEVHEADADGATDPSPSCSRFLLQVGEAGDEEAESLFNIRDALESLESQLSSLQDLQQQQRYEREAALAEIDYSRKILLNKLKEYKGEDLEVIHEASAFASETVEHNNDLLLPPYPSRPPQSLMLDNGFLPHFSSVRKFVRNGIMSGDPTNDAKKSSSELESNEMQTASRNLWKGFGHFVAITAKTAVTLVGVVSVLNLAGFQPHLRTRDTHIKVLGLFPQPATEEKKTSTTECPPGKVLVVEDGEARCLVKERVEIPFESIHAKPDVNYGCG